MVVVLTLSFKCSSSGFLTLTVLTGTPRFNHAPHLIPFFPFLMILDPRTTSASDGVIWMKFECVRSLILSIDLFLFQRPQDKEEEGKADQRAVRPPVTHMIYLLMYYFTLAGPIPHSWKQYASSPLNHSTTTNGTMHLSVHCFWVGMLPVT